MLHLDFPEVFSSAQSAAPDINKNTWPVSRRATRKVARCTRAGCQPAASAHTWNAIYLSFASSNSRTCRVCRARGTAERCILERASFATAERCILVRASCATSLDQQQLYAGHAREALELHARENLDARLRWRAGRDLDMVAARPAAEHSAALRGPSEQAARRRSVILGMRKGSQNFCRKPTLELSARSSDILNSEF